MPGFPMGLINPNQVVFPQALMDYAAKYQNKIEAIGGQLWDTQSFVSGTTLVLPGFWGTVRATLDVGNMPTAGNLTGDTAFLVRAVRFYAKQRPRAVVGLSAAAQTGALDNISQLINTGVFNFTVGSKNYGQFALWGLTAGGGASGLMAAAGATAANVYYDVAQNGIADPRAVFTLNKPIFLTPGMVFKGDLLWPAALTLSGGNTDLCLMLDGDSYRPAQ